MPTVAVSEDIKKYLEMLRKNIVFDKVPTIKETIELIIKFLREHEKEFLEWAKRYHEARKSG